MKRFIAVMLALTLMVGSLFCVNAKADMGDLLRFVPTHIDVTSNKVSVEGYFVNLNTSTTVKNFTDFEMSVYLAGDLLVEGNFGDITEFSISPLSVRKHTFNFNGSHELTEGSYDCDDEFYAVFSCSFKYV